MRSKNSARTRVSDKFGHERSRKSRAPARPKATRRLYERKKEAHRSCWSRNRLDSNFFREEHARYCACASEAARFCFSMSAEMRADSGTFFLKPLTSLPFITFERSTLHTCGGLVGSDGVITAWPKCKRQGSSGNFFNVKTPSPWSRMNLSCRFGRRSTIAVNPLTAHVATAVFIRTVPASFGAESR